MQHSQNLGNHTRKIAHKFIAKPPFHRGIYHQCSILCRLRTEREVGPRTRWIIAFHRSDMKVHWTVIHRRFAISKSSLESERLDTNWAIIQSVLKDMMIAICTTYADSLMIPHPAFFPDINLSQCNEVLLLFFRPTLAIVWQTHFV